MEVDGDDTVVVGLIGAGIGMSLSPALHEREAALLGIDYEYRLLDLDELGRPASDVGALVREARADGLRGLNVTHPCKQLVVPELDDLSPEAAALGAVNTIVFGDGGMVGHNTDASGFREAFERRLPGARTGHVVLLGAGGAGAAVGHAIKAVGARRLTIVDVEPERADALAGTLGARHGPPRGARGGPRRRRRADPRHADRHGRAPRHRRCRPSCSTRGCGSRRSSTCRSRRSCWKTRVRCGCRTLDGAAMVALQAAGSLELFTGARPDRDRMLGHVDELIAHAV